MDIFIKYNTPYQVSLLWSVEQLFFMGTAILTAKPASWTSKNFQRLVLLKENVNFLKWQGVAQDNFDDIFSTLIKRIDNGPVPTS